MRETGAWVYILRCADGSYYVGSSRRSVEGRVEEHNAGTFPGYTSTRRPVVLVYSEYCETLIDAFARERQLKGWSRKKKEALISGKTDCFGRSLVVQGFKGKTHLHPHPEVLAQRAPKDQRSGT